MKKAKSGNNLIVPIATVGLSCAVGFYLFSGSNSEPAVAIPEPKVVVKEAPTVQILVATNDIPIGKKLNFNDLSWRAWPESLLNPQYITQNEKPDYIEQLVGGIVKTPIISGEPIIEGKIVKSGGRGAMAVLLRKGMRAVSVPISVSTAVGGFILPGDYVDIILTSSVSQQNLFTTQDANNQQKTPIIQNYLMLKALAKKGQEEENENMSLEEDADEELNDEDSAANNPTVIKGSQIADVDSGQEAQKNKLEAISKAEIAEKKLIKKLSKENELVVTNGSNISEVMLENVKVLAIDQTLDSNSSNNQNQGNGGNSGQETNAAIIGATATLEVTPEQAKLLAWSSGAGSLTLSLRSFSENLSEKDTAELNQQIPKTKTSFAWAIKTFENADIASPKKIELIRNGNTSILYNQTSISDSNMKNTNTNTNGGPNVQR